MQEVADLEDDPFPPGHVALRRTRNKYRIRVGSNYRALYSVASGRAEILVERVRHRSVVYRGYDRR